MMKIKMNLKNHVSTLLFVVGLFAFRSGFADHYVVPSGSMEPTIQIGDHVLVDKTAYDLKVPFTDQVILRRNEPGRGDIIVFQDPRNPSIRLIKRLVGLPGDQVRVKNGFVQINGKPLPIIEGPTPSESSETVLFREKNDQRSYQVQRIPQLARLRDQEFIVPQDQYFFLGDNRDNSADSREWGFAPRKNLKGKAITVLYSTEWKGWHPRTDRFGICLSCG